MYKLLFYARALAKTKKLGKSDVQQNVVQKPIPTTSYGVV